MRLLSLLSAQIDPVTGPAPTGPVPGGPAPTGPGPTDPAPLDPAPLDPVLLESARIAGAPIDPPPSGPSRIDGGRGRSAVPRTGSIVLARPVRASISAVRRTVASTNSTKGNYASRVMLVGVTR